ARVCAGLVARADLRSGAAVDQLIRLTREASGGRLCGIRQSATWDPDNVFSASPHRAPPRLLLDTAFRRGFARVEALGLPFDASVYHPQLPELLDLVRAFPTARVVIDHCGTPLGAGTYAGQHAA